MAIELKEANVKGLLMDVIGDTISHNCKWVRTVEGGAEFHTVWEGLLLGVSTYCVFIENSLGQRVIKRSEYEDLVIKLYDAAAANAATVWVKPNPSLVLKPLKKVEQEQPEQEPQMECPQEKSKAQKFYSNENRSKNIPALKKAGQQKPNSKKKKKHVKICIEMWIDKE